MRNLTKENLKFGAAGFLVFALNSIFINFCILFFDGAGYSETTIGFMLSATVVVSIASQVVTGYLGDNYLTIKKILMIDLVITMAAVLLMIPARNSFPLLFVLFGFYSLSGRMLTQLIDGYITRVAEKKSALDFGFTRGISSIGYALASLLGGMLINRLGISLMFIMHTVIGVLALLVVAGLEDVPLPPKAGADKEKSSFKTAAAAVLRVPGFVLATLACFLMQIGIYTVMSYYPLIVVTVGGTSSHVGIGMFLLALSEVPVLWNYYRLRRKFKNGTMIVFSMLMYVLKSIVLLLFQNVAGVVLIQLMQSVTYAIFLPSALRFLQDIIPERYTTTGLMLWMAIYSSGGQVFGSLLGGILLENYGIVPLYWACAVFSLAGAGLMWVVTRRQMNRG